MSDLKGKKRRKRRGDWYSVSVDSVRLWLGVFLLIATGVGSYAGYDRWSSYQMERRAFENVAKSERLEDQLRAEPAHRAYLSEMEVARSALDRARDELSREAFRDAAASGQESVDKLQDILTRIRLSGSIAWFRSVQGDVRYRRGESGEFLRAYPRVELNEGDYVQSSGNSSAEIHFREDDTVFTLRPKTLIKLGGGSVGGDRTMAFMEYGWLRLDTSNTASGLRTPYSELRVAENSNISVELPENSDRSTLRVAAGSAEVRSLESGEVLQLGERQQVTLKDQSFGTILQLPPQPMLTAPTDDFSVDIDTTDQLVLEWSPVASARRYALQVSKSRLFGDNLVEASDRRSTRATLGLKGQGKYMWRVAAYGSNGALGPWSETRKFRVSSYRGLGMETDTEPPPIEVQVLVTGYIAVLRGKTEPGADLLMNGKKIPLAADGSFTTTLALDGKGRVPLDFRATDRAGNTSFERRWVFLDGG